MVGYDTRPNLRALTVLSPERIAGLLEGLTAEKAGPRDDRFNCGLCMWVPGATLTTVVTRLNETLVAAKRQPDARGKMLALGAGPTTHDISTTFRSVPEFVPEKDSLRAAIFGGAR